MKPQQQQADLGTVYQSAVPKGDFQNYSPIQQEQLQRNFGRYDDLNKRVKLDVPSFFLFLFGYCISKTKEDWIHGLERYFCWYDVNEVRKYFTLPRIKARGQQESGRLSKKSSRRGIFLETTNMRRDEARHDPSLHPS